MKTCCRFDRFLHDAEVNMAAFAQTARASSRSHDKTARLTAPPANRGQPLQHQDRLLCIIQPDGKSVVTASHDKTARLWTATGGLGQPLQHQDQVVAASSADGRASSPPARTPPGCDAPPANHSPALQHQSRLMPRPSAPTARAPSPPALGRPAVGQRIRQTTRQPMQHLTGFMPRPSAQTAERRHCQREHRPAVGQHHRQTAGQPCNIKTLAPQPRTARASSPPAGTMPPGQGQRHRQTAQPALAASKLCLWRVLQPDGKSVVTASFKVARLDRYRRTARPVNAASRRRSTASFAPDGKSVVTASMQDRRLWDKAPEDRSAFACRIKTVCRVLQPGRKERRHRKREHRPVAG